MMVSIELYTVQQLAVFLKKKPSTIYSDLIRRPESLPPVFRAPGSLRPLFVNPQQWVAGLVFPASVQQTPSLATPKRRGRRSNAEKLALQSVNEK